MTDRPEAQVILDSVSPAGQRMLTFQIKAHRFVLAEINTHRKISKNFRSSRAVPTAKLIQEVRDNPAMPVFWGKNQPGMQAGEELNGEALRRTQEIWRAAAREAANHAEAMTQCGLHKQISNRVLEPFLWVHGVLSATELMNMFGLRLHNDAQPEFQALAQAMWEAQKKSVPFKLEPGSWHLPYVGHVLQTIHGLRVYEGGMSYAPEQTMSELIKMSVARCARVSIRPFDSETPSLPEQDVAFYKTKLHLPDAFTDEGPLVDPIHASPAEHQATPDENIGNSIDGDKWGSKQQWGNLDGWRQYRKMLPGEAVAPLPKGYEIPVV